MAHLIQEYSKHCGVKIGKPVLGEHYFPIHFPRYITIDTSNNSQACKYPYWHEVVEMLRKTLPRDTAIVRITHPQEARPLGEDLALGNLTIKQLSYVIKNSMAHLCVYGFSHHIASAFGVPLVTLYSNNMPEYCGPVWSSNYVDIKPKYKNGKPSFAAEEQKPVIFSIYPDAIVNALRSINPSLSTPSPHKVNYIGPLFHHELFEVVPDFHFPVAQLRGRLLNIRMDENYDENILEQWLKTNRCSIISDRPLPLDLLRNYKRNIPYVNFFCKVGKFPDENYLQELGSLGIPSKLYCSEQDSEALREEMNRYFDFSFDRIIRPTEWPEEVKNSTHFKSNKQIFCKDGLFPSKAHMKQKNRTNEVIKSLDFLEELDHFYLYEQK